MARREFTEEEIKQLKTERELNRCVDAFVEEASSIIDRCVMIPRSTYEKGAEVIMELVSELENRTKELESIVRNSGMWQVGFADAGLNQYTMIVKTYKRAINMLRAKATFMRVLIHD